MKKHILFIFMLASFSMLATTQTPKKDILETVDKENKVSYVIEVMLCSNLTKVVSNAEGYEAYDRMNISEIMDEYDFEPTGWVNEDWIRQFGEISRADRLRVSEAVKFDESNFFVTAKILNVEIVKMKCSEYEK